LKREDKRAVVADLNQRMRQARVAILTRFVGLNVEKMTQLRRELRKAAVEYRIVKNTLLRLAIQGTEKEVLGPKIEGPVALAWQMQILWPRPGCWRNSPRIVPNCKF
jgi:large subunit ribosomal protein L10